MVYGRLEVFWPDGSFSSCLLEQDTVSVGRAEGNTIVLDNSTISRYHFSLTYQDDQVTIADMDSENGTFVDGAKLQAPMLLDGVAEIQAGHLRLLYQPVDNSPTIPLETPLTEETQRIERAETPFRLEVDAKRLEVWPASYGSTEVAITNTGPLPLTFTVQVVGLPEEWVKVNYAKFELDPNDTTYVLIKIQPLRRSDVVPALYHAGVQVIPSDTPENMLEAPLDVMVHGYIGFGMALTRKEIEADGRFTVFLHNQGSVVLAIQLRGTDKAGAWVYRFPQTSLLLGAGQRVQVNGQVLPKRRAWVGASHDATFDVQAVAQNASGFMAVVRGSAPIRPYLPVWMAISGAGIVLSALLLLVLSLLGVLRAPVQPTITSMGVNSSQLAQGDDLIISWEGEGIDQYQLKVNQLLIAELAGDVTSYTLNTGEMHGPIGIELLGQGGGRWVNYGVPVYIYLPMGEIDWQISPSTLVRHVVSNLDMGWTVAGAVQVRLEGLNEFSNASLSPTYEGNMERLLIAGIASNPLTIRLIARDEVGNLREDTRTILVIDPECTANQNTPLYELPSEAAQVVSTVPSGIRVVVDAQAAEVAWLRVKLPSGNQAWAMRSSLVCADTFNPDNLQKVFNTHVPTLTPAIIPPTATPTGSG